MSQIVRLVTQIGLHLFMATKMLQILSHGTHADDRTICCGCRSAKIFRSRELTLCSDTISTYYIFINYDSARGITLVSQKRLSHEFN